MKTTNECDGIKKHCIDCRPSLYDEDGYELYCEDCKNEGYIFTYNDKNKVDEFQRCDICMLFENDEQARNYILKEKK